ncbi:MAG: sigma-70 family RNA polymerase sigma factor [Mycobacterium sp.]|nr:sigma-70 family RNA polymerase sigma factor [Mycobacterium sp.]
MLEQRHGMADFADVYTTHRDDVARYLRRHVPDAEVEDLCSETFTRAWEAWPRYQPDPRGPGPWLMTIAKRRAGSYWRRQQATPAGLRCGELDPAPEHEQPERVVLDAAALYELLRRLEDLPLSQQRVLAMRVFYGLDVAETAQAMETTAGAVKALCFRARHRLARAGEAA